MQTTDNELIYLYKTENLHYAKEILFGRYNEKLTNITKYYVKNTFPSIDLSSNEIRSLVYLSIEKAIKKFKENNALEATIPTSYQFVFKISFIKVITIYINSQKYTLYTKNNLCITSYLLHFISVLSVL